MVKGEKKKKHNTNIKKGGMPEHKENQSWFS